MSSQLELDKDLQEAVEFLTENPEEILEVWGDPDGVGDEKGGVLFEFITRIRNDDVLKVSDTEQYGCLTQIKSTHIKPEGRVIRCIAFDYKLTRAIAEDERLPITGKDIQVEHLLVFAQWQQAVRNYRHTGVLEVPV